MATTLRARLNPSIIARFKDDSNVGANDFQLRGVDQPTADLLNGTGDSLADLIFSDQRTISASGDETLDLSGGSLRDPAGNALTFAKVKAVLIRAAASNTNSVVVGNATNPFAGPLSDGTTTITIPPGGALMLTAPVGGWSVTNASTDGIKVANSSSGSSVVYDIVVIGTSA